MSAVTLRLLQLGDSALPIGGYTHSWGLEAALARGIVRDAESLERWTRGWLCHAVGPLEAIAVAAVCRSPAHAPRANDMLAASLPVPTLRAASREMGEQLIA